MKIKVFLAIIALKISLLPGCMHIVQKPLVRTVQSQKASGKHDSLDTSIDISRSVMQPPSITIWVHGTRFLPHGVLERYFYSKPGLNHYTSIEKKYHQRRLAENLIGTDPEQFSSEQFYLFGWNGKLSFAERENAAHTLYNDLKKVREEYKKWYGVEPVIRMLAHSHGGNVILLLAKVKDPEDTSFFVNQIILMGTPVQDQTKRYACADCFGKVYSLYSMLDVLQVIDPQGLQAKDSCALFSERFFPNHEKIEQVAIKMNKRSIMHIEFIKQKFITQIPAIIAEIDLWHKASTLSNADWAQQDKCLCIHTKGKISCQT